MTFSKWWFIVQSILNARLVGPNGLTTRPSWRLIFKWEKKTKISLKKKKSFGSLKLYIFFWNAPSLYICQNRRLLMSWLTPPAPLWKEKVLIKIGNPKKMTYLKSVLTTQWKWEKSLKGIILLCYLKIYIICWHD